MVAEMGLFRIIISMVLPTFSKPLLMYAMPIPLLNDMD